MEVAPRLLTFYESRATVTSLRAEGGAVVTALALLTGAISLFT